MVYIIHDGVTNTGKQVAQYGRRGRVAQIDLIVVGVEQAATVLLLSVYSCRERCASIECSRWGFMSARGRLPMASHFSAHQYENVTLYDNRQLMFLVK